MFQEHRSLLPIFFLRSLQMAAKPMQDEVRELLTSNLVPDECIKLLEQDGCVNMKLLAKWAPDRITMQTLVLDKRQGCKDSTHEPSG